MMLWNVTELNGDCDGSSKAWVLASVKIILLQIYMYVRDYL